MALNIQLADAVVDGIHPKAIVEVVHGPVQALQFGIFLEKEFRLFAHVQLCSAQHDGAEAFASPFAGVEQRHHFFETAVEHIVIEIGESRRAE